MSLKFKFIPLTFIKDEEEIKKQIRNTVILKYFFEKNSKTVKLNSLIEGTQYGYNASALQAGKNKFLRISDITDGKVNWDTVPYCDCDDEETYLLYSDDILIARTGGTTGKSFFIVDPPEHAIYAGYLIRVRANKKNNPLFINLFLNSYVYWSQIVSINEGEFRPSANANVLKNLILPQCSPEEQEDAVNLSNSVIVEGYGALNNEIEKALSEFEKIKEIEKEIEIQSKQVSLLQQAILQEAIEGKLTADWREQNPDVESASELLKRIKAEKEQLIKQGKIKKEKPLAPISNDEIPFLLPDSWVWTILDDIALFKNGKAHEQHIVSNGDFILINSKFVSTNGEVRKYTNNLLLSMQKDEIAIVMSDVPNGRALSRCFIIEENNKYSLNQRIGGITPLNNLNSKYLSIILDRNSHYLNFDDGKKQTNLTKTEILTCPIPLPPFAEQLIIVERVEALLDKCDQLNAEIENQKRHIQDLQKALFNEVFELKEEKTQKEKPQTEIKTKAQFISLKPTNIDYHKRSILAAEIVWQLYKEPTLGHLKLQKLIFLCQKTGSMQLHTNFLRQAMGPYDNQLMRSIDKQLKEHKWFGYNQSESLKYQPLEKAGGHHADYLKYFSEESTNIQYIIDTFKQAKSSTVEIVATLYACMENILNEKNIIYSEGLLIQRFYEWSEEKQKFSEGEVKSVLKRMKEIGLVPEELKN